MRYFKALALLLLWTGSGCKKEVGTGDYIVIEGAGKCVFDISFDKANGAHWYSAHFDCRYTKGYVLSLPQGHYIATAVTVDKRDTLRLEFEKTDQWRFLSFDW
jgi:hypothetical protein